MESSWTMQMPSLFAGVTLVEKVNCFNLSAPVLSVPETVYNIDCAASIPSMPPFSVSDSLSWTEVVRYTTNSTCNGRPNVVFTITVTDSCGRQDSNNVSYIRLDNSGPEVQQVGDGSFFLQCGDTVPTFGMDFLSVEDNCSPVAFSCGGRVTSIDMFNSCNNKQVGVASLSLNFSDSSFNVNEVTVELSIIDTVPPSFANFEPQTIVLNATCTMVPLSSIPEANATDKCSEVNITGPVVTNGGCGVQVVTYTAKDQCGNSATKNLYYVLTSQAEPPTIEGVLGSFDFYTGVSANPVLDLLEGSSFSLNQTCNSNFKTTEFYTNEKQSVTVVVGPVVNAKKRSTKKNTYNYSRIVQAKWEIEYCGATSLFEQTVNVFSNDSSSIANLTVADINIPPFTMNVTFSN